MSEMGEWTVTESNQAIKTPISDQVALEKAQSNVRVDLASNMGSLTDGPAKIIRSHDGIKICLALVLSNEVVETARKVDVRQREVGALDSHLHEAYDSLSKAKRNLNLLQKAETGSADNGEQDGAAHGLLDVATEQVAQAEKRCKDLKFDISCGNTFLNVERTNMQSLLMDALRPAGLLDPPKPQTEISQSDQVLKTASAVNRVYEGLGSRSSITYEAESEGDHPRSLHSQENSDPWAIIDELQERVYHYREVTDLFERRHSFYEANVLGWKQARLANPDIITRTELDLAHLEADRKNTRAVIEASEALHETREYAKALGMLNPDVDDYDPLRDVFDWYEEDGNGESDASEYTPLDERQINRLQQWILNVEIEEVPDDRPPKREIEDWDAKSVAISESQSMLAPPGAKRRKIQHWRNACGIEGRH